MHQDVCGLELFLKWFTAGNFACALFAVWLCSGPRLSLWHWRVFGALKVASVCGDSEFTWYSDIAGSTPCRLVTTLCCFGHRTVYSFASIKSCLGNFKVCVSAHQQNRANATAELQLKCPKYLFTWELKFAQKKWNDAICSGIRCICGRYTAVIDATGTMLNCKCYPNFGYLSCYWAHGLPGDFQVRILPLCRVSWP